MSHDDTSIQTRSGRTSSGLPWRLIAAVILLALTIVFLVENTRKVPIRFIGPEVKAPLIVALLIAAILGSLATLFFQYHRHHRK